MSKKINPARFVTFTRDHVQRTEYKAGQTIEFGSVNAAKAFVKALNGENPGICQLGRGCSGCLLDSTPEKNAGNERTDLFATYADARRALVAQGATRARPPESGDRQFFYRPAPAFPGQWGESLLLRRSDGWWTGPWILEDGADARGAGELPFVDGLEGWGQS